eukprot:CAMPEP_0202913136 /NCGR_PEP_ID=MMETSP1392-20130828/59652_1 /ASSEMBLY_ACC=CAM_ASM_000868 /TAXON_ID=225041 /ORGANISM="Chlamydomonas chlamydogama, Strain SAG 11-48b" /LENGTH=261 /DNA_ID=CAMNT_0049604281 /DNA_START=140 /DNA_END=925 /DNA_ORIENTATION=+
MAASGKLKLLCLHGYLQNSEVFKSRIGSMRKGMKSRLEFEFVQAPYEAQALGSAAEEQGVEQGGRSWWQWTDVGPEGRPSRAAHYTGWEAALDVLVAAIKEHRPDGILGFSQGATATALLLACLPKVDLGDVPHPKFAIMVAGFLPRDPSYARILTSARPAVRSLFVYGTNDALVPPERTQQLIDTFEPSCVNTYVHGGAHLVPTCSGEFKQALVAFLDAQTRTTGDTAAAAAAGKAAGVALGPDKVLAEEQPQEVQVVAA